MHTAVFLAVCCKTLLFNIEHYSQLGLQNYGNFQDWKLSMGMNVNKLEKIAVTGNLNVAENNILQHNLGQKPLDLMQVQFNFYPTHCSITYTQHTVYCRAIEATPPTCTDHFLNHAHKYQHVHLGKYSCILHEYKKIEPSLWCV